MSLNHTEKITEYIDDSLQGFGINSLFNMDVKTPRVRKIPAHQGSVCLFVQITLFMKLKTDHRYDNNFVECSAEECLFEKYVISGEAQFQ